MTESPINASGSGGTAFAAFVFKSLYTNSAQAGNNPISTSAIAAAPYLAAGACVVVLQIHVYADEVLRHLSCNDCYAVALVEEQVKLIAWQCLCVAASLERDHWPLEVVYRYHGVSLLDECVCLGFHASSGMRSCGVQRPCVSARWDVAGRVRLSVVCPCRALKAPCDRGSSYR